MAAVHRPTDRSTIAAQNPSFKSRDSRFYFWVSLGTHHFVVRAMMSLAAGLFIKRVAQNGLTSVFRMVLGRSDASLLFHRATNWKLYLHPYLIVCWSQSVFYYIVTTRPSFWSLILCWLVFSRVRVTDWLLFATKCLHQVPFSLTMLVTTGWTSMYFE
jgi:hypothetical protein